MDPFIGERFGRLTVIGAPISNNGRYWPCKCDCGNELRVSITALGKRRASDGGCSKCPRERHGHGRSTDPTYSKYQAMRQRCENPKNKSYPNYGGRGIVVCERWRRFDNFLADMNQCPSSKHSIDRKDSNGNYEPGNCRWATSDEQANNKRTNRKVEIDGMIFPSLKKASDHFGISANVVLARLLRGNSIEVALKAPLKTGFKGDGLSLKEAA